MANVKISDLSPAGSAQLTMQFEVNDSGNSRRVTGAQVDDLLLGTVNGFVARTGTNARAARTLTGGTGISVTNGNGAGGNPTVALSSGAQASLALADSAVQPARTITAGTGLTGGGDLSTNRTIAADTATDANIHAGTANKLITSGQLYTASAPVTSSGSGNHAFDFNAGRTFARTLTGNSTLTNPTNQAAGQSGIIYIIQDATGGRTLSLGADYKSIGAAPTIVTTANAVNVFSYYVRSATNITLSYLGAQA